MQPPQTTAPWVLELELIDGRIRVVHEEWAKKAMEDRRPSVVIATCPKCSYYVGAPVMCKGQSNPTKKGFWFEKCLNNEQPAPDSCDYFKWRSDIPRGKATDRRESKKVECPGLLCRQSGKPNPINVECTFGVRRGKSTRKQAKEPVVDTLSDVGELTSDSEDPSTPKTPSKRPPAKRASYATPTGPAYQARISEIDAERRLFEEERVKRIRQEHAKSQVQTVTLRWWTVDGGDPEVVEIIVENASAFHPKDIPQLVEDYRCGEERFQYYDSKKGLWYMGSKGSAPRDINKLAEDDFCYRSLGVTSGKGMPGISKKRPATEELSAPVTPRRPIPPFGDFPITPESRDRRAVSPAATTPPGSGSSAFPEDEELAFVSNPSPSDPSIMALTLDWTACTSPEESFAPIPALFPPEPGCAATPKDILAAVPLDLSTAPRGRHGWPWKYVCDMADGLAAMRKLQDSYPSLSTAEAFESVFKEKFKSSTFSEQIRAWRNAGEVPGERARWINMGRDEHGEWTKFMIRWRPTRR
ncbi:hypothetical protein GSI_12393 [Ganoderma sinense ZZ0214-1]|uniref:Uncharacterized protein n=1 Tax=Ganoderma sinense ZZ0214-1 TaxID=1077348 RepID=A0A2G8RVL1_9APHY|nr:hypothetical protein GSI_12393 [Ganoderma sinense ZZ0214-1]